jgi:antitoxin component of MazEF toxin-antitoxin module
MGYKTRIQLISRKNNHQFYIMCPTALAQALELQKGEFIEWIIKNKNEIIIKRKASQKEGRKK